MTEKQKLIWMIGASIPWGVVAFWLSHNLVSIIFRPRRDTADSWEFETARRIKLRKANSIYRWFEPLVDELVGWSSGKSLKQNERLERQLRGSKEAAPWKPQEYIAVKQIESLGAALFGGVFGLLYDGWQLGAVTAILAGWGYQMLMTRGVADQSRQRAEVFKRRLPFAIDLMAFMMEAGASFQDSIQTVVNESGDHPLAQEISEVIRQIRLGTSRQKALLNMQDRLADNDITELVFALNTGEELGTPLSQILRNQANQMRTKRSQWAERAAAEAQVTIVFPGMLIMIACLLIVIAPFILSALV
ncbi:MAG: Type secretion system protein TadC, associated with Flp pilus assembly [Planctomycetaceae bacterium]|nr:Type secretion system protein TadC, associated with Flp pilus assembly [Planctomycetaceae bacterium]